jgi:hypothetical protein
MVARKSGEGFSLKIYFASYFHFKTPKKKLHEPPTNLKTP